MTHIRPKTLTFAGCLVISLWLLVAQVLANTMLLIPCLLCFIALVLWACVKGMAVPALLFFLPWSPLLKITPGTMTVYTIALLAVLCVCFILGYKHMNAVYMLPALALLVLTLVVKLLYGYTITNSYILFFALLLIFPLITREKNRQYDFYDLTLFFSVGIIIAALTSRFLVVFPTISRFIEMHSYQTYFRHAGFYGDPNFYSAHITAAMAGIMVLISRKNQFKRQILLTVMLVLLTYCGLISFSKTFVLIAISLVLLWIIHMLFQNGKVSAKLLTILSASVAGIFILSSTVFSELIDVVIGRFIDSAGSLSDFTTNRTDIWLDYFFELTNNPLLLLFGKGYTSIVLHFWASHNTIIQIIYQFGVVGTIFFLLWFWSYAKLVLKSIKIKMFLPVMVLLIGAFGPWLALDMLFFDEVFLVSFYVFSGICHVSSFDNVKRLGPL